MEYDSAFQRALQLHPDLKSELLYLNSAKKSGDISKFILKIYTKQLQVLVDKKDDRKQIEGFKLSISNIKKTEGKINKHLEKLIA